MSPTRATSSTRTPGASSTSAPSEVHLAGNTGQGVKVAVIDTGIDYIHDDPDDSPYVVDPEFLNNYKGGYDFFNNDDDPMDDNGHGTHVAGILAAEHNGYLVDRRRARRRPVRAQDPQRGRARASTPA